MTLLGREVPTLRIEILYSELEIKVLKAYAKKRPQFSRQFRANCKIGGQDRPVVSAGLKIHHMDISVCGGVFFSTAMYACRFCAQKRMNLLRTSDLQVKSRSSYLQ